MQQIAEAPQVGGPHGRRVSRAHVATGGAVEHPPGQFQRSTALVSLAPAPRHRAVAAIEMLNYEHALAEPRVPGIMDVARRGIVGLVLRGCTTTSVPISRWAIGLRPRSIGPGPAESESGTPAAIPDRPRVRVLRFDHPGRRQAEGVPPVLEIEETPPDILTPCRVGIQSVALGSAEERSTPSDDIPQRGCKGMAELR
jgi:hypothetical protein